MLLFHNFEWAKSNCIIIFTVLQENGSAEESTVESKFLFK